MSNVQTLKFVKREPLPFVTGVIDTPAGPVSRVSTEWSRADYWGMIRSRVSAFRMNYAVPPGLYAAGDATRDSDVFVTANYKLSFDTLRRELAGMNAWILVLDTKSINVWCAAGKGTFGTDELVSRVVSTKLDSVVSHRRLILPQLGAVGVNAAVVQKRSGFRVSFGPVQARDIAAYVRAGYRKTPEMSLITFSLIDRLVLTPMELNPAMKKLPWIAAGILLFFGLQPQGLLFREAWFGGLPYLLLCLLAVLAGAFITPVLLPYVPFRSFAIKGWITGLCAVIPAVHFWAPNGRGGPLLAAAAFLLVPALSSYLALQFTGATTYTGMSGVKKELKAAVPVYIATAGISLIILVGYKLLEWEVL